MPSEENIQAVLEALGYTGAPGYLQQSDLPAVEKHRHAFAEAFQQFNVIGIFSLIAKASRTTKNVERVPLVYVAVARTAEEAREVHRATWSQGIVPFLIVITDEQLLLCNALAYSSQGWEQKVGQVSITAVVNGAPLPEEMVHLAARSLRTSVVWADREMGFEGRIDMRLLDNLRALTTTLLKGSVNAPPLPPNIANALIGRFLYVRFLRDRGVLPQGWLPLLSAQILPPPSSLLPSMWASFSKIERVFNGSIFIVKSADRSRIKNGHATLLAEVLLNDADLTSGGLQTSFRDFRFSSIRTETLSAVYELFLETSSPTGGREDGAIYTPPFLVDFVLSQVEQEGDLFSSQDRVLDCAAGSGVFLVGAFRRIVESTLVGQESPTLTLQKLHLLLRRCIWGIERNLDACHVAAFSLYLTMLDYLSKEELSEILEFAGRRKVFPTLVPQNILPRDFFSKKPLPRGVPKTFTAIIANPPWQKASEIGVTAVAYQDGVRSSSVDRGRVAPLFFWKAFDEHLAVSGRFGFVMSGRALISSGASRFPTAIVAETGLSRVINLSHMRRKLFPRAEHPAVVIVGSKYQKPADEIRVFSPLLSSQPVARDGTPWVIIEDRCETEIFRRARLQSPTELIRALTLRPIDRQLARWLSDRAGSGKTSTLGQIMDSNGLSIKRGGYLPETGVGPNYTLGSDSNKRNYYRTSLGLDDPQLFPTSSYQLPASVTRKITKSYLGPFGGNAVIIPRSMTHIDYLERPFAFNSSINAIYSRESKKDAVPLLKAIADYLNTKFAEYCFTLFGRDWSLDERRLEQKELRQLPAPLALMTASSAEEFSIRMSVEGDAAIYAALGLSESYQLAAKEFASFRLEFQNGQIPAGVHSLPESAQIDEYVAVLARELSTYVGKRRRFRIRVNRVEQRSIAVVALDYLRDDEQVPIEPARDIALDVFDETGVNVFQNSAWLFRDQSVPRITVVKPLSRAHWTVERAFADAERIIVESSAVPRVQN